MNTLTRKRRSTLSRKKTIFAWLMLALPIAQFLVFFVYVNFDSIVMSFQSFHVETGQTVWTFDNFQRFNYELTHFDQIGQAMLNSLYVGLNDILLTFISLLLSYFFYKKLPGRQAFRVIFFLPNIISIVIYTMVYKYMFNSSLGTVDALLRALGVAEDAIPDWLASPFWSKALILLYCLWVGTGYNILILSGAMEQISPDVMEYSRLEGVGTWRELFEIVTPMIWPTLSVSIINSFTLIFTFFLQVQLITGGGPNQSTETIAFLINSQVENGFLNWAATIGVFFSLLATPLILAIRKGMDVISKKFGY